MAIFIGSEHLVTWYSTVHTVLPSSPTNRSVWVHLSIHFCFAFYGFPAWHFSIDLFFLFVRSSWLESIYLVLLGYFKQISKLRDGCKVYKVDEKFKFREDDVRNGLVSSYCTSVSCPFFTHSLQHQVLSTWTESNTMSEYIGSVRDYFYP